MLVDTDISSLMKPVDGVGLWVRLHWKVQPRWPLLKLGSFEIVDNEVNQISLDPHLRVKEVFPFLWFFWFTWPNFGGGDCGIRFKINNFLPSFRIWLKIIIDLWLGILHLNHEGLLGATFIGIVPRNFMVLTPFSCVFLHLLIALLVLQLGLVFLRAVISIWSLVVWVGVAFTLLRLWEVRRSKLSLFPLKFFLNIDSVSISCAQWGNVQELHFCLNVSMQTTAIFEHQMTLRVFDTQFGA